jgi:hypothetical protein
MAADALEDVVLLRVHLAAKDVGRYYMRWRCNATGSQQLKHPKQIR